MCILVLKNTNLIESTHIFKKLTKHLISVSTLKTERLLNLINVNSLFGDYNKVSHYTTAPHRLVHVGLPSKLSKSEELLRKNITVFSVSNISLTKLILVFWLYHRPTKLKHLPFICGQLFILNTTRRLKLIIGDKVIKRIVSRVGQTFIYPEWK